MAVHVADQQAVHARLDVCQVLQPKMLPLTLTCFFLAVWCSISECVINLEPSPCPVWTYHRNPQDKECMCGSTLQGAVSCLDGKYRVSMIENFCTILSKDHNNITDVLIGTCPYSSGGVLPLTESELDSDSDHWCIFYHRTGQLCGACVENYTLPVYSYYLGCVKCEDYKYGWVKFITAAFLPLTAFYILVIIFQISATSSTLNGFVLVSQIMASPSNVHKLYSHNQVNSYYHVSTFSHLSVDTGIAIYAIWNLDFFRSFYKPICLSPDLKYQHVLLLDYAVAVYPLLLIFITFICVKLHDNFAIVVWLWMPFHKCLVRFRNQWNIRSCLVNALATFIVLSYIKILNVSFQFFISSIVYDLKGQVVSKVYWYYDGRVDMTSREYLPYLVFALFMSLTFNVIPLVLLTLYPFKFFQILLNCCPCLKFKLALRLFMDTFHGCYKDKYRHFAALYLSLRFFNLLLMSVLRNKIAFYLVATLLFMLVLTLVANFHPYKHKRSNTVDIVMLLTSVTGFVLFAIKSAVGLNYQRWVYDVELAIVPSIPLICMLFLALAHVRTKASQCFRRSKAFLLKRMSQMKENDYEEERAILSQGASGYNTFP